ncbi:MAG: ATP-binding cassette domain-containing protein [Planctomycetes bacterium]|nr:ATP-binding cassette domain-containing protein [Planctomycetota bacterium]
MHVDPGEVLVVIGISGCGKSTLLRSVIGAYRLDGGSVRLLGRDVTTASEDEWLPLRRRLGILFQQGALYTSMSVGENIALPMREHTDLADPVIEIMVRMKLDLVGLGGTEDLMPAQLSGGMQKRVALARALALDPEVMFYDEPTTGLDPIMAGTVNRLITDFNRKLGVTSLVITQDMNCCYAVADRVIMLYEGKVYFNGTVDHLRTSSDPVVEQFVEGRPDGPVSHRSAMASA